MIISDRAAEAWDRLEPTKSFKDLRAMVRKAKPYSGSIGNKIFQNYVFLYEGGVVKLVRDVRAVTSDCCPVCGSSDGKTTMYDDFLQKEVMVNCYACTSDY